MVKGSKRPLKPTIKQKRLLKIIVADTSKTMGQAMIEAGYSPLSAVKPSLLTKTERWQQLLEKYLPDDLLTKTAVQGLKARKIIRSGSGEVVATEKDGYLRHKYLETALKMKGKLIDRVDTTTGGQQITGFTFIAPSRPIEAEEAEEVKD